MRIVIVQTVLDVEIEQVAAVKGNVGILHPPVTFVDGFQHVGFADTVGAQKDGLVVDDVKMNLNVVRLLLKNTEMQIDLAASGEECLKYTLMKRYDLILMDHMMPVMDGIEALHKIREQATGLNTETPVVALTANALVGAQEMYLEEGFVSYLSKPVKSGDLEECILKLLPEDKIIRENG